MLFDVSTRCCEVVAQACKSVNSFYILNSVTFLSRVPFHIKVTFYISRLVTTNISPVREHDSC